MSLAREENQCIDSNVMSPQIYHFLHVIGVILYFTSLGGLLAVAGGVTNVRRLVAVLHGVSLLLLLVAGFGWLAKAGGVYPLATWVKTGIWLVLALLPMIVKKRWINPGTGLLVGITLGAVAAYIGYFKPMWS